jgi:serine/threonine protein kinase
MANLAGQLIANRYLVRSLVADGGMASVYLAQDQVLDREVALKVIHPHLSKDKSFVDKFRREAKVAAKLSHPNLVNVFDQGTDGEVIFLVMEYVAGITLRDAMNDFGALDAKKTLEIVEPLTSALAAAHAAGILHRDLKPENVIVSLTRPELEEIIKKGQLSTVNKNIKTFDIKEANLLPNKQKTLLENVDTSGMTKQQKKKLKKKIKKNIQAQGGNNSEEESEGEGSPAKRHRGPLPNELKQLAAELNNEIERPRSYSLPNLALNQDTEAY